MSLARFPFARLGALVIVGSVAASMFHYYVEYGRQVSDLTPRSRDVPTDRQGVIDYFLSDFLFTGSTPSLLLWAGVALVIAGIVRNLAGAFAKR